MNYEELNKKLESIPDQELHDMASVWLQKICKDGKLFTMSVPVRFDDTDIILGEVIKRFREAKGLHNNN